jgi:RNA polymerase sigma-70 factor, ECF subfamily
VVGRDASGSTAEAFASLYDEHVWRVYGFFGYRVNSRPDAEDLTQQTFERALRAWDRFDPSRASAATWLIAIARNLLIDHYRQDRSGELEPVEEADLRGEIGVEQAPEDALGLDPDLERALSGLRERERELIALRFGGDLTGLEIAELTGLTLANVQQILSRSLRRLRAALEEPDRVAVRGRA